MRTRRRTRLPLLLLLLFLAVLMLSSWLSMPILELLRPFYLVARAVISLIVYGLLFVVLPLVFAWWLCGASFSCLVRFQNLVSDHSRRRRVGDNSRNLAASLPPEVQLRIFRLLHQRGHFGYDSHSRHSLDLPYPPTCDLHAVARVCRSWSAAATEVLYCSIPLADERTCILFNNTLVARPALAYLVRRFSLPESTSYLPHLDLHTLEKRISWNPLSPRWKDVKSAVDQIVVLCVNATDVRLCDDLGEPEAITGLMQCIPRIQKLSLRRTEASYSTNAPPRLGETRLQFPSPILRPHLAHLQELTLLKYILDTEETAVFSCLLSLRLILCHVARSWVMNLLINTPNLQALDWCDTYFLPLDQEIQCTISDLVAPRIHALTKLTLAQEEYSSSNRSAANTLGDMCLFSSLRVLEISTRLLYTLEYPPPQLHTLVLYDVRDLDGSPFGTGMREAQKIIYSVAARIKHSLAVWKLYAPHLRTIQLWDLLDKNGADTWTIAAFLLHGFLSTWDVSLVVNVWLGLDVQEEVHNRVWRKRVVDRLLWRNVF
ncbi:hypothetical protein EXIGLDRAFT_205639 [Exidia glandulosa HHB12029]|uniref:Uncharacterized protein n=1 Tax=Exidia glandulosa HHB12029 TaxID=1314781 RepID=A0A165MVE9_EXIGL|nr:hypothetical protein EXIGLDRAFT_205639 [Exidia glandulosa HHB12029]